MMSQQIGPNKISPATNSSPMPNSPRYPDFLCIGAQRAGTSWLYSNLRQHPQIWLPPLKELHYFDTNWPSQTSQSNQWNRRWLRHVRHLLSRIKDPRQLLKPESKWLFRYLFLPRNDRWYGSLFPNDRDLVVGEMTPRYAMLDEHVVAHMASLMPKAKIIYILRNPIERSWSAAAMHLEKQRAKHIDQASDEEIQSALDWMQTLERTDYVTHIELWSRHFGDDNPFVGFFDELAEDPASLLRRILDFLNIDTSPEQIPPGIGAAVGATSYNAIPEHHLHRLAKLHLEQIQAIHDSFANAHTEKWLNVASRIASRDRLTPIN
jgi:hypothetical protein